MTETKKPTSSDPTSSEPADRVPPSRVSPDVVTPIALTIAGSDSGGGAGIQADLKTFSALGVYGASVITALTAQNTRGVTGIHDVPTKFIRAQLNAVFDDLAVTAVKIGMLSQPEVINTVAHALRANTQANEGVHVPMVLDPVMVAKSGDALLQPQAVTALKSELIPLADVITPNLPEAAVLLDTDTASDRDQMEAQAEQLLALGAKAVVLKGGHLGGDQAPDLLITCAHREWLEAPRVDTHNTHGTGCTLSSAIAAGLAKGLGIQQAVTEAKEYIVGAIAHADDVQVGQGHGPVQHFYRWW